MSDKVIVESYIYCIIYTNGIFFCKKRVILKNFSYICKLIILDFIEVCICGKCLIYNGFERKE